jgi:hypothetical protein
MCRLGLAQPSRTGRILAMKLSRLFILYDIDVLMFERDDRT